MIDPTEMRGLGFCVSVDHAEFMARAFTDSGLPSRALSGRTPEADRVATLRALERGELRVVFSVDVLGEGVDVPSVDTVLLLRPTDGATVFTQQLGRGLRRAENKPYLTVIDLIGQQHREFRFDRRLGAIVDRRRGPLRQQLDAGFPFLPSGCSVDLDRQSPSPATLRAIAPIAPRSNGRRHPADPPRGRGDRGGHAGQPASDLRGERRRGLVVVSWRPGLRITRRR
ncbi:helicase-related protein [Candidatus Solirubrobacter pratensis]|uniref:helicase-related protein n=1 Tax=Candidatus Solirubrobacter pratensis TaxID=1298857 RepID=UPI0003FF815D|nr:helicase-related protein [Candidatus Solirubrobacter pratensis]